jgi:hypothetical protein
MKNILLILPTLFLLPLSTTAQVFTATNKYNNIVRIGIDNHLVIKVPGVNFMDVITTTNNGSFGRQYSDSNFIYMPTTPGDATIHIAVKTRNGTKKIGDAIFHVKEMPSFVATLCGKKDGNISKAVLMNCPGPTTPRVEELGMQIGIITSFDLKVFHNNVVTYERTLKMPPGVKWGTRFDVFALNVFKTLKTGDIVSITDIKFLQLCHSRNCDFQLTVVE